MVPMNLFVGHWRCRAIEMQTQRTDLWTQRWKERVGQIERVAWKYIHYHM